MGGGERWSFPAEISTGVDCDVAYVYSFLFEGRATGYLSAGGTAVIGLGHGITDDSVASHPFYGTARVIDALKDCPASPRGGLICSMAPTSALPEIATSRRSIRTAWSGSQRRGPSPP